MPDKIIKNQRKTFGTFRDLLRVKSVGIIEEDKASGIVKYAKPVGLVCRVHAIDQSWRDPCQQGHDGAQRPQRDHHCALAAG